MRALRCWREGHSVSSHLSVETHGNLCPSFPPWTLRSSGGSLNDWALKCTGGTGEETELPSIIPLPEHLPQWTRGISTVPHKPPSPRAPLGQCILALWQQLFCLLTSLSVPTSSLAINPLPSPSLLFPSLGALLSYARNSFPLLEIHTEHPILPFHPVSSMKPHLDALHLTTSCSGAETVMQARLTLPESRRGF